MPMIGLFWSGEMLSRDEHSFKADGDNKIPALPTCQTLVTTTIEKANWSLWEGIII